MPPMSRVTVLALRGVPAEIRDLGNMIGCTRRQMTWRVLVPSAKDSLMVGVTAAILSTVLGICAARAITRYRFPGRTAANGLIMAPLVLPEIILAVSLLIVMLSLGLELSLFTVVLGHVLICIPYSVTVLNAGFEGSAGGSVNAGTGFPSIFERTLVSTGVARRQTRPAITRRSSASGAKRRARLMRRPPAANPLHGAGVAATYGQRWRECRQARSGRHRAR